MAGDETFRFLAETTGLPSEDIERVLGRGTVAVLSKPDCVHCAATKRALTARGVGFVEVDGTAGNVALDLARRLGYLTAPSSLRQAATIGAGSGPIAPGGRGESHPPAPTDPDVNLSVHPALVVLVTRRRGTTTSGRRATGHGR